MKKHSRQGIFYDLLIVFARRVGSSFQLSNTFQSYRTYSTLAIYKRCLKEKFVPGAQQKMSGHVNFVIERHKFCTHFQGQAVKLYFILEAIKFCLNWYPVLVNWFNIFISHLCPEKKKFNTLSLGDLANHSIEPFVQN